MATRSRQDEGQLGPFLNGERTLGWRQIQHSLFIWLDEVLRSSFSGIVFKPSKVHCTARVIHGYVTFSFTKQH